MAPDGTRYFFAKRTGDTQWHEPAALQGAKLRLVLGEALPNGPTLPHPWRRLRDAETGRAYYWDVSTGTTQWERPDTPGVAEGALVSASRARRRRRTRRNHRGRGTRGATRATPRRRRDGVPPAKRRSDVVTRRGGGANANDRPSEKSTPIQHK